ncbi:unnamed protein product [Amoebophrya sp. A25]|nr:unnamed protein product [Amoebophrya sp. A25]|eukprot:GSA25T00020099001.1
MATCGGNHNLREVDQDFNIEALILCPTRDLVYQVRDSLEKLLLLTPDVRFTHLTSAGNRAKSLQEHESLHEHSCQPVRSEAKNKYTKKEHGYFEEDARAAVACGAERSSVSIPQHGLGDLARIKLDRPHILVATPGKVAWHLMRSEKTSCDSSRRSLNFRNSFGNLETLVLDEADALLDMSAYYHQVSYIVDTIRSIKARDRSKPAVAESNAIFDTPGLGIRHLQTVLASATFAFDRQKVAERKLLRRNFAVLDTTGVHKDNRLKENADAPSCALHPSFLAGAFSPRHEKSREILKKTELEGGFSEAHGKTKDEQFSQRGRCAMERIDEADASAKENSEDSGSSSCTSPQTTAGTRTEFYHVYQPENLMSDLVQILSNPKHRRCLVVFPTRRMLQFFYVLLKHFHRYPRGAKYFALHTNLAEDKRRAVVERFTTTRLKKDLNVDFTAERSKQIDDDDSPKANENSAVVKEHSEKGTKEILFASDVAGRGLDFCEVDLVVQVGMGFLGVEQYTHRCGRTARHGKHGESILLLNQFERDSVAFGQLLRDSRKSDVTPDEPQKARKETRGRSPVPEEFQNTEDLSRVSSEAWNSPPVGLRELQVEHHQQSSFGVASFTDKNHECCSQPWWSFNHFYASSELMYKSMLAFFDRQKGELKLQPINIHYLAYGILRSCCFFTTRTSTSCGIDVKEQTREGEVVVTPSSIPVKLPDSMFPPKISRGLAKRLNLGGLSDVRINTNTQRIELLAAMPSFPGFQSRQLQQFVVPKKHSGEEADTKSP